jgi:hypothetical protein
VTQFDLALQSPGQKVATSQFGAVIAAYRARPAANSDDSIQRPRHSPAGKTGIYFQRQTLSRVYIDHTEYANRGAVGGSPASPGVPYCFSKIPTCSPLSLDTVCVIVFPSAEIVAVITATTVPFSFIVIFRTPASVISQISVP